MAVSKKNKPRKFKELQFKDLDYRVTFKPAKIKTSDDVAPCCGIIGQTKAIGSIKLGLSVKSPGYNIFVTGLSGTGRSTTIKLLLEQLEHDKPQLNDICYVNNFKNIDCPQVLVFKAGDGTRFKKDMNYLISSIRKVVPKVFMSEDYKDRQSRIIREFEGRQKEVINAFEDKLSQAGFVVVQIQAGMGVRNEIQPLVDNEPSSLEKLERLAKEGKFSLSRLDELRRSWDSLRREFDTVTVESKKLTNKLEDALAKLDLAILTPLVADKISLLKKRFPDEKLQLYLEEVEEALLSDIDRFREAQPRRGEEDAPPYRKREPFEEFSVNLILDNSETEKVPIVIEKSPSYKNIFGSLERVVDRFGYWRTDFTRIHSGSLLRASGGFFIINAMDLLTEPGMWVYLRRALRNRELEISGYDPFYMMAGAGIKPEPIPLAVKVVLIGEPEIYHLLWRLDEDFKKIFKVKAEFDNVMKHTRKNLLQYFEFVRKVVDEEELPPFDMSGMQAVCEYGMRLSGRRNRLTTRFTPVSDIVKESAFCCQERQGKSVSREDVYCAIKNRVSRVNLVEEKIQEMFDDNTLLVSTKGTAVGQINGLSVYNIGEYAFGRPTRITANTSLGKEGIINIEREADLSGPIHNKGVLVLTGYLRQTFAQDKPLAISASISFEQSYSGVDGDSASATEILAILSSISGIPMKQNVAVTGSVNQKGEIQPVGGVNEKIEGFFDVCESRRLTGDQGVIIPYQNVSDLMLRPDVIDAVKARRFHVYPIKTLDEGIEIMTGWSAGKRGASGKFATGSVLRVVDDKLHSMAMTLQNYGRMQGNNNTPRTTKKKR
ncbi:MAG: AAA family ATPase [Candidatus Zixiibacteriota bacterium]|nr:MAG: AAA family ATPase [candidate division Zixibacteria bacterium]